MRSVASDRNGFSLVELVVVLVGAGITVGSGAAVFINSNRVHLAQTAQIQLQQTGRAGIDVLSSELREVSHAGGDIIAIGPDSVSIRLMGQWTMACDVDYPNSRLNVMTLGNPLEVKDSIALFAENDTLRLEDDVWLIGEIQGVTNGSVCISTGTPWTAHWIDVSGMAGAMAVDIVRTGAPVRTFQHYTYGSYTISGEEYLGRHEPGGAITPLVGPIKTGGLAFAFRDELGNATATLTDIAQIDVSLAMDTPIMNTNGTQVQDSLFTTVFVRN